MKRYPARADDAQEAAKSQREADASPGLRIESVRMGASDSAMVAVGGSSFLFRLSDAEALGLETSELVVGTDLEETSLEIIVLAADAFEAEKKALDLLARAEQSAYMLTSKLEARGFSKKAARMALEKLQADGVLSDRRFAEAFAASRLSRRAEGPSSLVTALRGRGIDGETAKAAVEAVLGPEERGSALAKAAAKALKKTKGDEYAARRILRGLGFKSEEVAAFFEIE